MSIIISIFVLALSLSMFILPRRKKLELIFFSSICLQSFSFSFVSFGSAPKMLCLFFFLSELPKIKTYLRYLRSSQIGKLVIVTILGVIILEVYSTYAHNPMTALGLIINELISKYFIILYVIVCFSSIREIRRLLRIAYWSSLIITFFGLLNLITGTSIITEMTGGDGTRFSGMERVRIVGMFPYAFDYGFTCCVLSIFALYGYAKKLLRQSDFIIVILCCLIGIIICGCRTVVVVEVAMGLVYVFNRYSLIKALALCAFASGCIVGAYLLSPVVKDKVNMTLMAFDSEADGGEADGSSLIMRVMQFDTVLYHIKGHEVLGRGYRFFIEGLGYDKNGNGYQDLQPDAQALMGLEGVLMNLLLERGLIGVLMYMVFYGGIIVIVYRYRKTSPDEVTAIIAIIIGFVCFGNMTGELSGATITLFLSGALLKVIYLRERELNQVNIQSENTKPCPTLP